ncbi:MAG: hypothetical protein CTY34_00735 [Methylobacter sp.]|nr:MAG: hypothetical protein CTY34_00735 [Methylobacter sp.]PPD19080.1 MAG: hypothetical protein CTY24_11875 [Methylobacter sp.]PPD35311.1 MAG: hypothetical protein CTY18_06540 [Methylomonas sp.]
MRSQIKQQLVFVFLTVWGVANAGPVTVNGNTVSFTYDSNLLGLFGTPIVAGDSLFFTPTEFTAQSLGAAGLDLTNSTVNIQVSSLTGGYISLVGLTERGDFINHGAFTSVNVGGEIRVTDLSAPLTESISSITPTSAFASQSSIFPLQDWVAVAGLDFSPAQTGSVNVTIQNILAAFSSAAAESAFIEKTGVILAIASITPEVSVPLPASAWLFGTAIMGGLAFCKKAYNF